MTETVHRPRRRTQAERRATTRAALLEATIEGLVELGYGGVTTADIATRAQVTRGAQAHHFTNKADLVTEAVRFLAEKLIAELEATFSRAGKRKPGIGKVLDLIWEVHRGPIFTATAELWVAARTDADLRDSVQTLIDDVNRGMIEMMSTWLPEVAALPGALGLFATTTAAVRGLAMLAFVQDDVDREWRAVRRNLLDAWTRLVEDAGAA